MTIYINFMSIQRLKLFFLVKQMLINMRMAFVCLYNLNDFVLFNHCQFDRYNYTLRVLVVYIAKA